MKRYGNLYEKICHYDNLLLAHMEARKGKSHYLEVKEVNKNTEEYLKNLEFILKNEIYYVNSSDYRREIIIDKGKEREIMKLSYYPHRIVQWAIMNIIEDIMLKNLIIDTYASVRGRGIHLAAKRLRMALNDEENTQYCLKLDIRKFYPSIDNKVLLEKLKKKFKDPKLIRLLEIIIFSVGEKGQPIGSLWSQFAGNFYLSSLDHWLKEEKKIKNYFRYCDDIVILHHDKAYLHNLRKEIDKYVTDNLNLEIKGNWQVFPTNVRGIDFLGYRFFRDYTLLRKRTLKNMKIRIKKINKKKILNYSDSCSLNSYCGWLKFCNGYRLKTKYLFPLQDSVYIDEHGERKKIRGLK